MNNQDIKYQSQCLRDYVSRGGSEDRWFKSKDFSAKDRRRIAAEASKRTCAHRRIKFNILSCADEVWCGIKGGFINAPLECGRGCAGWKED